MTISADNIASASAASVDLSWDSVPAAGYIVTKQTGSYISFLPTNGVVYTTGAQNGGEIIFIGTATSFIDNNIIAETGYHYYVASFNIFSAIRAIDGFS